MARKAASPLRYVFVLCLLAVPAAASADVLITKSGSRYVGTVSESGGNYVLVSATGGRMVLPKSMVRQVIKGPVPDAPPGRKEGDPRKPATGGKPVRLELFVRTMKARLAGARRGIEQGDKAARKRQQRRRDTARKVMPGTYRSLNRWARAVRTAALMVRNTKAARATVPTPTGGKEVITPQNAGQKLSEAQLLLDILQGKRLPPELAELHKRELAECAALKAKVDEAEVQFSRAAAELEAARSDPNALRAAMDKHRKHIEAVEQEVKQALAALPGRYDVAGRAAKWEPDPKGEFPPEPEGFFTARKLTGPKDLDPGKVHVVVVLALARQRLMPSLPEYVRIQQERFRRGRRRLPARSRLSLHDPKRFELLLAGGQTVACGGLADWRKPGADVPFAPAAATAVGPRSLTVREKIAACFALDADEAKPPFKLRLDGGERVVVPDKKLQP